MGTTRPRALFIPSASAEQVCCRAWVELGEQPEGVSVDKCFSGGYRVLASHEQDKPELS